MPLSRALQLALVLAVLPLWPATAQFGGMPGLPGSPGKPQEPCQQLLRDRDELVKHREALQAAGEKKALPDELCKLFTAFIAAERKMIKGLEEHSVACGVPFRIVKEVKDGHGKASQMGAQICAWGVQPGIVPAPAPKCFATKLPSLSCVFAADD
jgi:hypothetical protein